MICRSGDIKQQMNLINLSLVAGVRFDPMTIRFISEVLQTSHQVSYDFIILYFTMS